MILVLGGARSGKSRYAVERAREAGDRVLFCATAEPHDDEMRERIRAHRAERPAGWRLVEEPVSPATALRRADPGSWDAVIVDCVTLLVNNLLLREGDRARPGGAAATSEERIEAEVESLAGVLAAGRWSAFVVSNEVGTGVVSANPLARRFRDALGSANQRLAGHADEVVLMVAGIPVPIARGDRTPGA